MYNWISTALAALIGAFIASFVAEFLKSYVRKHQKIESERDYRLAEINLTIDRLVEYGEKLWSADANELGVDDNILRSRIVGNQQYLLQSIAGLLSCESKTTCDVVAVNLVDALSGGDFGTTDRKKSHSRMTNIQTHSLDLRHTAHQQRTKLPRPFLA